MVSNAKFVVTVGVVTLVSAFAGGLAWSEFQAWRERQRLEEARAAVEAEKRTPRGRQREAVKRHLVDPESAQFRNDDKGPRYSSKTPAWCGEVNARNRMGGLTGFTRYVAFFDEEDDADLELVYLDEGSGDKLSMFKTAWRLHCQ
jgi:hypothetical protein